MQETLVRFLGEEDRLEKPITHSSILGLPLWLSWERVCLQSERPGLGRFSGEGKGYPLQYSGLENSMDCIVHGVAKSQTRLSDFHIMLLKMVLQTSLVVQWLRTLLPVEGLFVWSLVQEDPTSWGATKPVCHHCRACMPQRLEAMCLGAESCKKISHSDEKPMLCN